MIAVGARQLSLFAIEVLLDAVPTFNVVVLQCWRRCRIFGYALREAITRDWLDGCIADFNQLHDRETMPWHKQGAFDRGSFASLLGVFVKSNVQLRIDAVGDSIAVLCDGPRIVKTFPYQIAQQFDDAPTLLSTDRAKNPVFTGEMLSEDRTCLWTLHDMSCPRLFCMTDALGQWLLTDPTANAIERIDALHSRRAFERFVREERSAQRLKRDDTTLLVLW